jgi:methane/ammonia monooxygenase subunit B
MIQSTKLETGREYEFRTVLRGRIPGRHHVHPMLNVRDAGPLLGPGTWIEVTGSHADFRLPLTTLTGDRIDDLQTWGVNTVLLWHGLWMATAAGWLLWWLRRPLFAPRYAALKAGFEDALITPLDLKVGVGLLLGTLLVVSAGYHWPNASFPRTVPLQAGKAKVEPLPAPAERVHAKVVKATYDVPGRSLRAQVKVTNGTSRPVSLGEFTSANLRFANRALPAAMAAVATDYPRELVAHNGLQIDNSTPIKPGETRTVAIEMTDAAWEVERLAALLNDPDSRFGALLFFYDAEGNRHIASISGPVVPRCLP